MVVLLKLHNKSALSMFGREAGKYEDTESVNIQFPSVSYFSILSLRISWLTHLSDKLCNDVSHFP